MSDGLIDRLRRLRKSRNETWQGGLVRLSQWVIEKDQIPCRPWIGVWVSLTTGRVNTSNLKPPLERGAHLLIEALAPEGQSQGMNYRPQRIEVADAQIADQLRAALSDIDIEIEQSQDLPGLKLFTDEMTRKFGTNPMPPTVGVKSVTPDHLRAFAEAAEQFYRAAPWQHLTDEDLIRIESAAPPALSHVSVMGAAGRTFGLGFFPSAQHFADLRDSSDTRKFYRKHGPLWSVMYYPITGLPQSDADFWEYENFPAAGPEAYPQAASYDGAENLWDRPDAAQLAFMEGVLRALADTTESEMDIGRWTKQVQTFDGPTEIKLALPGLLDEPAYIDLFKRPAISTQRRALERALDKLDHLDVDREFQSAQEVNEFIKREMETPAKPEEPTTLQQAEDLVDQAAVAFGRRRKLLLRRALETDPNCAEAYLLMAYGEPDQSKALPLFEQAVASGLRSIGENALIEHTGQFWQRLDTRPYMRSRMGLAECLRELRRPAEAISHFQDMLRLNPRDNQGVHFRLLASLLDIDDLPAAAALADQFPDDRSTIWSYGLALLRFRQQGDTNLARTALSAAFDANYFVPNYLLKKKDLPASLPPMYRPGSEDEAVLCVVELQKAWDKTPGAIYWLTEQKRRRREREERKRREK